MGSMSNMDRSGRFAEKFNDLVIARLGFKPGKTYIVESQGIEQGSDEMPILRATMVSTDGEHTIDVDVTGTLFDVDGGLGSPGGPSAEDLADALDLPEEEVERLLREADLV